MCKYIGLRIAFTDDRAQNVVGAGLYGVQVGVEGGTGGRYGSNNFIDKYVYILITKYMFKIL